MKACNKSAFTLLEVIIVMAVFVGLMTAAVGLLKTQMNVIAMVRINDTFTREGATIQAILTKLVSNAQLVTLHSSLANARAGSGAVRNGGAYLRLWLTGNQNAIIGYESGRINYYAQASNGTWPASPNWNISRSITGCSFDSTGGVVTAALTWNGGNSMTIGMEGVE